MRIWGETSNLKSRPVRFVALLRGINVGGKNKVDMTALKRTFARAGATDVLTYVNSGNVIFSHDRERSTLTGVLEDAIEEDFGLRHRILLRDTSSIRHVVNAIPDEWVNDGTMRTDVLFLWEHLDSPDVVKQLPVRDGIDEIRYAAGAVIWRVDAENLTRSGKSRLVGTDLYKAMTVRNVNTVRKLAAMIMEPAAE